MKIFDKKEVNTGRQFEFDLMKAICIIGMVFVHCFEEINYSIDDYEGFSYIVVIVLDCLFGASSFMFCMGLGMAYSKNNTPAKIMKRGIIIFILAYVLNFLRGVLPVATLGMISNNNDLFIDIITELINNDILHFAGPAMILFGFLLSFKNHKIILPVVAIILSIIGSFVRTVDFNNLYINQIVGLFIGVAPFEGEILSCFPICNWFIFVVAGYSFAGFYKHCADKKAFFKRVAPVSWLIVIVYMCIAIPTKLGMMGLDMRYFYYMTTLEALVCIVATFCALSLHFGLSHIIPERLKVLITSISQNINAIYCIHWVLLCWVRYPFKYIPSIKVESVSTVVIIFSAISLLVVSSVIAHFYRKWKVKRIKA